MFTLFTSLRRAAVGVLFVSGCHGLPLVPIGATVVTYPPFDRWDCNLKEGLFVPGGALLIDSEEAFRAKFECYEAPGARVERSSGVDFSRDAIAVFLSFGQGSAPKFARLERKDDRLKAIFRVEAYCGGAEPYEMRTVQSFLLRREPVTLESQTIELKPIVRCPTGLP